MLDVDLNEHSAVDDYDNTNGDDGYIWMMIMRIVQLLLLMIVIILLLLLMMMMDNVG